MNLSELKRVVARGESNTVEFKETLQEEALHTVGAFANVRGGALLLGVNDAGVFVGVDVGKVTLRDLNLARVRRYMTLATNVGRRSFEPGTKPREVVEKLELVRGGHPTTWTSILLFGKRPQSPLIQATAHCGRFRTETDIVDDRLIEGSIVDQIAETMDFLKKHTNVRFIITGKPRRDQVWDYPLEALRAAVVNAICHRDYGDTADIQIKVFDDHIRIWNPGFLPHGVTIEDLYRRTHASKPRNKLIAQVFYDLEIIERYGSGIQRMLDACRAAGIPEPTMAESTGGFLITFRGAKGGFAGPSTVKAGAESAPSSRQVTGEVVRLLDVMQGEMQRREIQNALHLRHENYFRAAYLVPALKVQLIEMTIPGKPRNSKQRYRLTEKGRAWLRSRPSRNLNDLGTAGRVGP